MSAAAQATTAQSVAATRVVLPRSYDTRPATPAPARPATAQPATDPESRFADMVQSTLQGPVLRYSQRLALLREAQKLGIPRFEANLIIARVLHQEGISQELEMRPRNAGRAAAIFTALLTQAIVIAAIWWLLHAHR